MGFLNVSREAETIQSQIMGKMKYSRKSIGRHKHPKAMGFSHISQDMRKLNSHSKGKAWENKNIPKLKVSYIFRIKQKSINSQTIGGLNFHLTEQVW